eukprot:6384023-Amphidinium_carterae.1
MAILLQEPLLQQKHCKTHDMCLFEVQKHCEPPGIHSKRTTQAKAYVCSRTLQIYAYLNCKNDPKPTSGLHPTNPGKKATKRCKTRHFEAALDTEQGILIIII